jgi:hypothetical protein
VRVDGSAYTPRMSDHPIDHRAVAVTTYNRCWELLETEPRTTADDADLLTSAFTSRYHWTIAGGPEQHVVADWMVSRAASAVGQPHLALGFAHAAFDRVQHGSHPAWLRASVFEVLARAHAAMGDQGRRDQYVSLGRLVLDQEPDPDDRRVIADQLETVPTVG